ncbi:MAG: hypothetical protein SGJ19_15650 [Planctomycetia bacterium]|nr:hypothetical protein [Planctomycetia bacterium]
MLDVCRLYTIAALSAGDERLQQITSELGNNRRPILWSEVAIVVGFLVLAPLIAWVAFRRFGTSEPPEPSSNPRGLFNELCDGHELGRDEREFLEQLAKRAKLEPVARIFLEPDCLTNGGAADLRPAQRLLLAALNVKLFGGQPLPTANRFAEFPS